MSRTLIEEALVEGNHKAFESIREAYIQWLSMQDLDRAQDIYFARAEKLAMDFWKWVRENSVSIAA